MIPYHSVLHKDNPRTGRPKTSQVVIDLILATVTRNSTTRKWSCKRIAYEVSNTLGIATISTRTIYNILTKNGYSCYKKTVKPRLKDEDKEARLKWCLDHKD